MQQYWSHFSHDADIGVRGCAESVAGAFEQAALALTAVVVEPATVAQRQRIAIDCAAPDLELLLVDWLNALIYHMATRRLLFSKFQVSIDGSQLHGQAWGEPVQPDKHQPVVEIKGATYTALRVAEAEDSHWIAQCVVDV